MFYTDDPVADFNRWDEEMYRRQERCLVGLCECCGEAVYDYEDYYDIDGILLHSDCMTGYMDQFLVRS